MSRRIIIGQHPTFSSNGIFLSRPGDDVVNPSGALLLDSRFQNISAHAEARVRMDSFSDNSSWTVWWCSATFPDLGYRPLFYGAITYVSANSVGIPQNTCYYPNSECAVHDSTLGGNVPVWGVWLHNDTTVRAKIYARSGYATGDFDFHYIIFKKAT